MQIKVRSLMLGPVQTNCYLVSNEETHETIIFDPGDQPERVERLIDKYELKPVAIMLTHGHFDHIMAVPDLIAEYGIPLYANEKEKEILGNVRYNSSDMLGRPFVITDANWVKDGDFLTIGGMDIKVIWTPGHTIGGTCYYFEEQGILIAGDTLFQMSVGRTDFYSGSMSQLIRSIREKLFVLPDDVIVYPGHMGETSIGFEKKHNPFLQ